MKKILYPIVLMSALFVVASCSKSFDPSEEVIPETKVFTASIEDEGAATKTTLDAKGTKVNWVADDQISIIDSENKIAIYEAKTGGSTTTDFTYVSGAESLESSKTAYYPSSLLNGTTATFPATQTYDAANPFSVNPMYATTDGSNFSFKNICGILKITLKYPRIVKSITVTSSDKAISGAFTVNTSSFAVTMEGTTEADKTVTLNCGGAYASVFYIALPPQTYTKLTVTINGVGITKTLSSKTIARNTIYTAPEISVEPLGKFTVADDKTVAFSPANLYWDGSAYKFEQNQYDYPASWSTSHVGHFFWTNLTDYQSGIADYMMPYASSYFYSSRSTSDTFFCGVGNKLSVNGSENAVWYALSKDEWSYLISNRTNASNLCKYGVTVIGKSNCLVIAPDGYSGTLASSYDATAWATAEAAGLVCLPAAGGRNGSSFLSAGSNGVYWSSTPDASSASYAFSLYFSSSYVLPANNSYRSYGFSLRLVRDIE